ncbi:glycoside hydrolase family 28 protein [uncultured Bacteroides sp.]|uniref:glycoside hydrolase family 28 protein n=1 Tax=uncultured Bacteroides sp. TaxID=162156 RepID=UPI002AA876B4|nr:glycoside hydrolase family 28 protein [uncultured Bacteroides sp.]
MKISEYALLLLVVCMTACVKAPKQLTVPEKIIENIAKTSFPERSMKFVCRGDSNVRRQLQQVIDSCSQSGGGKVVVEKGTYKINGSIVLKPDVNLHLEEGACMLFSGKAADYLPVVLTRWEGTELYGHSPMIYAYHANNIAITGKGVINAQGGLEFAAWSEKEIKDRDRLREMGSKMIPVQQRIFGEGTLLRPSCIQFLGCSRILVDGVTVKNSPFWTIHPVYCDNVIVRGVTIDSHYPNNDGCDPESTTNVLIENCTFKTGDDAVAIKSGRDRDGREIGRSSKNIVIRNCIFNSECNGLCIGSEMSGGVENVYMSGIKIGTVKNAIYFKSNKDRGGYIRNVFVDHITVERVKGAILRFETNYFGFRGGNFPSTYEHFEISDVKANVADNYAVYIDGLKGAEIHDISVSNFHVKRAKNGYYLFNTRNVTFESSSINKITVPKEPEESLKRISLDVY